MDAVPMPASLVKTPRDTPVRRVRKKEPTTPPVAARGENAPRKMAAKAGMTKADAKRALDAFLESTQETLKKGESLTLIGFGSFSVSKRAARTGHNPQKPSETIKIPAKNVVRFSAGATLKKAVNSKKK